MNKILCYNSKDIHLPSSMYLDPLCVQINNLLHTGYCNILCKYVNMAFFYYAFFDTEDYILFPLNKFIFIQNNIISWSSHCAKYCCPGNWLNQQSCVADKLEHEEKYDGRIEELQIDTFCATQKTPATCSTIRQLWQSWIQANPKSQWGEAFQVSRLYNVLHLKFWFGKTYQSTYRGETIPLLIMWKGI
jgi:hypothetical protein